MRTLILIRHAKSSYPPGVPDRERPLAERGVRDAHAAGAWLRATFPSIDTAVISPATRARDTWSIVSRGLSVGEAREDSRVYDDWGSALPSLVSGLPPASRIAVIVGHNPGIEELAIQLGQRGDERARERMLSKYPTCGIAVIGFDGDWSQAHTARLCSFAVPRG